MLDSLLDEVEASEGPAALVTTGAGKFYSNGLDLGVVGGDPAGLPAYVSRVQRVFAPLHTPRPSSGEHRHAHVPPLRCRGRVAAGIVHEAADADAVLDRAVEVASSLADFRGANYAGIRGGLVAGILPHLDEPIDAL